MVNAIHPILFTKAILKQQLNREKRSAIMMTSSQLGHFPCAGFSTYSAAKSLVTTFA